MSACRWLKHFPGISGRFRYRRDQKKVDELNAVPGNTIGATTDPAKIREADVVIIAVPTPVTRAKDPDPGPVVEAHRQFRQMPAEKIRSVMNDTLVLSMCTGDD